MRVGTVFVLAAAALFGLSTARADTVAWRSLGRLPGALKIAACSDGELYYVGNDGWLWVNRSGGGDRAWQRLPRLSVKVEAISCAAGRLHVLSPDKTLYRNDGDDTHPRWKSLGRLTWASQVVAATFGRGVAFYALSDDGGLLVSEAGVDKSSWRKLGQRLAGARRISAASLRDVFGLDADGRLHVNHGRGLGPYWLSLDAPSGAIEIASADARSLYALAQDGSLWEGSVRRVVRSLTRDAEFEAWLRGLLGQIEIAIWKGCERQVIPEELRGEERLPRPGPRCRVGLDVRFSDTLEGLGLRDVRINGPGVRDLQFSGVTLLDFTNFSSSRLTGSLDESRLQLAATFENTRFTASANIAGIPIVLGFEIANIGLSGDLMLTTDSWDDVVFSLANLRFDGELRGTDLPGTVATWFFNFKRAMEGWLGPALEGALQSPDVQTAIREILLQYANFSTHETWHGIVYGGIGIGDGALVLLVER